MKNIYFKRKIKLSLCVLLLFVSNLTLAQVGIGTTTPATSSVLEVASTTQGMLTPRMTTAQRTAIVSPADGLIVYDTDLKAFYHYNSALISWNRINSDATGRLNFKRIRSSDNLAVILAAELAVGLGAKYVMDANTYYEINGTVVFNHPIDINNSYISGQDTNNDRMERISGNLFEGATGGSIRSVTLKVTGGGKVFNLSGTAAQNLVFRDAIVANSANVGSINGFGLVFVSVVQFANNDTGIVYSNIRELLISNVGWFGDNRGTFETLSGTFTLVEKQGGFSSVNGTAIGFDVSANPTITGDAIMESVVFTGTLTSGKYVSGYNPAIYTGYNFNNSWNVRCSGIPTEIDAVAVGDINFDYPTGAGANTFIIGSGAVSRIKLAGATTSNNLFRFSRGVAPNADNRLIYLGKKKRFVTASGSVSFQTNPAGNFILYIAKNGVVINQSKVYALTQSNGDIATTSLTAIVDMNTNDYLEFWVERFSAGSTTTFSVFSLNLVLR